MAISSTLCPPLGPGAVANKNMGLFCHMGRSILEKEVSQTVRTEVDEESGAIELFD